MVPAPNIITCKQWQARPPKVPPLLLGRPDKIIVHHTDGHGADKSQQPPRIIGIAMDYAQELQHLHMDVNGWNDSGHNFLVMRSGLILQGRWGSVAAIEKGRMVQSAHCPGENGNPGIEHEHLPGELFTSEQRAATVALMAWICDRCKIAPTHLYGHDVFFPTACPSNLAADIPALRLLVAGKLTYYRAQNRPRSGGLRGKLLCRREGLR